MQGSVKSGHMFDASPVIILEKFRWTVSHLGHTVHFRSRSKVHSVTTVYNYGIPQLHSHFYAGAHDSGGHPATLLTTRDSPRSFWHNVHITQPKQESNRRPRSSLAAACDKRCARDLLRETSKTNAECKVLWAPHFAPRERKGKGKLSDHYRTAGNRLSANCYEFRKKNNAGIITKGISGRNTAGFR